MPRRASIGPDTMPAALIASGSADSGSRPPSGPGVGAEGASLCAQARIGRAMGFEKDIGSRAFRGPRSEDSGKRAWGRSGNESGPWKTKKPAARGVRPVG